MQYVSYDMHGHFFELCDCSAICPCWVGEEPDNGACTGVFGWDITAGKIATEDVTGCQVVSVSYHTGNRKDGGQDVFLFIDENTTDGQFQALANAFTGRLGGPLTELALMMGSLRSAERAPIKFSNGDRDATLSVSGRVSGEATMLFGPDGQVTELSHSPMSEMLGARAEVGNATLRTELGLKKLDVDVAGRAAMRGRFSYRNEGTLIETT